MTRTRIKICGLTREQDVQAAVAAGADALGFVFYPASRRHVTIEHAARLMSAVPPFIAKVGLFVNATAQDIANHLGALPIDLLQFHGDETPEQCIGHGRPWLRAARIGRGFDLLKFSARHAGLPGFAGILADALVDGYGGAGKTFDWQLIPTTLPCPLVLSGGLQANNVASAIRQIRPFAVDVSSGVEVLGEGNQGIKSAERIERFIREVQDADANASL